MSRQPRITVIVPCFNDGQLLTETLDAIREPEPVEVVIVDDGSTDPLTLSLYPALEARGFKVVRHGTNRGLGAARNTGLITAATPYVFNLDADDLLVPEALSKMASLLDAHPDADVCYGDYEEFGARAGVRRTAASLDPYRVAYVNKSPALAMFRRDLLTQVGGWPTLVHQGYEDWGLWMRLAVRGSKVVHVGAVVYRYRVDPSRLFGAARGKHRAGYEELKQRNRDLFAELRAHRRRSEMPLAWKLAYPLLYAGGRPRLERARRLLRSVVPTWSPALTSRQ